MFVSAYIRSERKAKYLGSFRTEEAAALAYNEAALKEFKEFACLNRIKDKDK